MHTPPTIIPTAIVVFSILISFLTLLVLFFKSLLSDNIQLPLSCSADGS